MGQFDADDIDAFQSLNVLSGPAHFDHTVVAGLGEGLVRAPVAVVVQPVAHLRGGADLDGSQLLRGDRHRDRDTDAEGDSGCTTGESGSSGRYASAG